MSLLKVNEVQNFNGSSLTLTASTVSTSAQLNTGGNISVTGSLNVSDDSTTRSNLGLGSIATQASDNIAVTGGTATLGALTVSGSDSGDLVRITQTGSGNALVVEDSANPDSTPFVVDASGNVGIGTSSPNSFLDVAVNLAGSRRFEVSYENTIVSIAATSGTTGTNRIENLGVYGDSIRFYTDNTTSERMRIDSSGNLLVGTTTNGTTADGTVIRASGEVLMTRTNGQPLLLNRAGTDGTIIEFRKSNSFKGSISISSSSVAYNTTSDYRLKENLIGITDGISRIKQLNPSRFNFIADPSNTVDGFIAHEVSNIVPEAISGEKDAVDDDGNPEYQGIDQSKLVPLLTAALQESIALIESQQSQIDALTTRIEALEATS